MDGGAWWAAVHGVAKSWTQLSDFTFTFHFHALEKEWQPTPAFLPGESQGQGSLVGCHPNRVAQNPTRLKQLSSSSSSNGRKQRGTKEPLVWRWKKSEKAGLKLNIQKSKIMASGPITSWQIDGEKMETLFSQAPKSLWTVTTATKLEDACSLEKSYDKPKAETLLCQQRSI